MVELDVPDGEVEPVEPPVVELVPAPAPESVGVFTWPAAPPDPPEVAPEVDGMLEEGVVVEVEGVVAAAPVELLAPIDPLAPPVELAALVLVPVVAAMFAPDHQSREARSFGEAARYSSSIA